MSRGAAKGVLDLGIVLERDPAGTEVFRQPAAVGAGTKNLAVPPAGSIGPPVRTRAGLSAEAAAISWAGMVLSQLPRRTTPSSGWARIISSVSIAIRLR